MADYDYNIKHKTWTEINLPALRGNYAAVRAMTSPGAEVMCVVKADAYGHGAERCACALYEAGGRWFAVSCIEEAMQLRAAFDLRLMYGAKILILGYTPPENADILARYDIRQTVFSPDYAAELSAAAVKRGCAVRTHFKVDTGMNRLGFDVKRDAATGILRASYLDGLAPEGIFTHFACADENYGNEYPDTNNNIDETERQFEEFLAVDERLRARGLELMRHVCNSAATVRRRDMHLDMVRAGIILYGLEPFYPYDAEPEIKPVMTFKSIISHIHEVRAGERVSYGGTYTASGDIVAATIPVGYADGFIRDFQYGGGVYIHGAIAPGIGRVCMDQCMVDVTGIRGVKPGSEVVLFGEQPEQIRRLADAANTINYELVCLIGKRVARIYSE